MDPLAGPGNRRSAAPRLDLTVAPLALTRASFALHSLEKLVVRLVGLELHGQLEAGGMEQLEQGI